MIFLPHSNIRSLSYRSLDAVLPLPLVGAGRWFPSRARRLGLAITTIAISFAAIVVYIGAVNMMLLGGEALRQNKARLGNLEQEHAILESLASQRQSPAWLVAHSRANGMVEVDAVRYLVTDESLALHR